MSDYQKAKSYVIRIFAKKNYASFELRKKLDEHSFSDDIAERLIDEFTEAGYIDDNAWLKNFIRLESARKHGSGVVLQKLLQKNPPEELLEQARTLLEEEDHSDQIRKLLETRYRTRNLNDYREREKTIGSLVRRGYRFEDIKETIAELLLEFS